METVSKEPKRSTIRDIGAVVGVLATGVAATAAFARYGMNAKGVGDYVAVAFSVGPPLTIACGVVASGISNVREYANTLRRYLPT